MDGWEVLTVVELAARYLFSRPLWMIDEIIRNVVLHRIFPPGDAQDAMLHSPDLSSLLAHTPHFIPTPRPLTRAEISEGWLNYKGRMISAWSRFKGDFIDTEAREEQAWGFKIFTRRNFPPLTDESLESRIKRVGISPGIAQYFTRTDAALRELNYAEFARSTPRALANLSVPERDML
eukprot:3938474-Rhodomonas_salina.1